MDSADVDVPAPPDAAGWNRLRGLFEHAIELPPGERDAWLDAHARDASERDTLRRLVAADTARGALDDPAAERAARIGESRFEPEALVGTRIGAFRLVRALGQGGMATVFLGERDDPEFRQRVAIKLLRRGLYSSAEQRLFQRERRALAALSHPNIAHLVDGGVTEAGVPYLVLEYVDGTTITEHASSAGLGLRARLALFAVVCRAVAAAHRALVVHRDIKPSNILVDREGRVKLLDFGIAKLLDEHDESATGAGFAALTPGYAAPEQYRGGPISTATDVYALGVLLHELLLGERPREAGAAAPARTEAGGTPLPAARRVDLRGDLATILATALAAEPERRYDSAAELADDVERHLASHPIRARPATVAYRLGKFVRRHSVGVALAAAFALGVLASLALVLQHAREARLQAERASEVQRFVETLFEPLEDGRTSAAVPSLHELLERGVARVEASYPENPEVRAELLSMFARIRDGIGEGRANRELARAAWRASAAAWGDDDLRTLEARALHARVLRIAGELDASLAEYASVRDRMRALGIRGQPYARVLDAYSLVRMAQGIDAEEAIALKREVLDERESDPASTPDDLVAGYNNLGAAYQYAARYDEALAWFGKSLELGLSTNGENRANANTLANIGLVYSYQGRWHDAAGMLERARAMYAAVPIERSANLVSLLVRQCAVLGLLERHDEARARCDDAVAMAREVHGEPHASVAQALTRRAGVAVAAARYDEALGDFAAARAVIARLPGDPAGQLAIVSVDEAKLWHARREWARVREAAAAVLDRRATPVSPVAGVRTPGAPLLAAWVALACEHDPAPMCGSGRRAQAERIALDPLFARSTLRYGAATSLARIDLARGDARAALARLDTVRDLGRNDLGPAHSWRVEAALVRAEALARLKDPAAAAAARAARAAIDALPAGHLLRANAAADETASR